MALKDLVRIIGILTHWLNFRNQSVAADSSVPPQPSCSTWNQLLLHLHLRSAVQRSIRLSERVACE